MIHLPAEGELLAGKYRVERIIGRGGMGVVYAAWHLELDQYVALKFLLTELAERGDAAARFRREARAAAKIKSEHVARVLDVGNFDGSVPYIVMELLEGCDMAEELRTRGPLPVQETVDYLLQALEAVAEAHALGIVHRDLKPENIFVARRSDGSRTIKVLDFGISKSMMLGSGHERSLTQTSTIMGSPLYMSPEQMRAPRDVDGRSDIWSLGAIFYELLSGRPPFIADSIPQLCAMLVEATPTPLRELRPDVPEELERVVARCLEKALALRWNSVGELARALLPFASSASAVHAERVARMSPAERASPGFGTMPSQGSPGRTPDPSRATPPRVTPGGGLAAAGALTPLRSAGPAVPTMDAPRPADALPHPSQQAWGQTRPPGESARKWSWIVAGSVVLLGAAIALWSMREHRAASNDAKAESRTSGGVSEVHGAAAAAAAPLPAAVPTPLSGAGQRDELVAPLPLPSSVGASPSESVVSPPAVTRPAAPNAVRLAPHPVATAAAPRPQSSGDLTDFGGRR